MSGKEIYGRMLDYSLKKFAFCDLVLEVRQHHFCHIVFIINGSQVQPKTKKRGIWFCYLKEGVSKNLWTYFKTTIAIVTLPANI